MDKSRVIFRKQQIITEFWGKLDAVGRNGHAVGVDTMVLRGVHTGYIDMFHNSMVYVSHPGDGMQSRVGYEILHAAGLNFLAADDHDGFVANLKALEYVQSKTQQRAVWAFLRKSIEKGTNIFDHEAAVKVMASAIHKMFDAKG